MVLNRHSSYYLLFASLKPEPQVYPVLSLVEISYAVLDVVIIMSIQYIKSAN